MTGDRHPENRSENSTKSELRVTGLKTPSDFEKRFREPVRVTKMRFLLSNLLLLQRDRISAAFAWELERGIVFNFLPVFLAIGIGMYFFAPAEPLPGVLTLTAAILCLAAYRIQTRGRLFLIVAVMASILTGMLAAKLSVLRADTPQIERQMTAVVTGIILGIDQNRRGSPRMILKPTSIEGLSEEQLPKKIRVSSAAGKVQYHTGMQLMGLARIQPVSGPVYPGSYDFSFFGWFNGLGGSGFFMGKPEIVTRSNALTAREKMTVMINAVRDGIEQRVIAAMPETSGNVAVALITGDKSRIPENVQQSLRNTGLAHILAISGLHMALVTLTLIACIRFIFSFFPNVVLHYPVKKWAVCFGFVAATLYLFLSGFGIATQRAWIMISVMLLAVLLDKRAITMRSVAVSACIILLVSPESLFAPGFQMSFAAVAALVSGYEVLTKRRRERAENSFSPVGTSLVARATSGITGHVSGLVVTSLIAGTATAFVAAWHFHQVAPLGLLANVLAMPIVGFIIMPFALFSMLLMPYGLEAIALWPVDYGITWVIEIARWVDSLSPVGIPGLMPGNSLLVFGMSLAILTLFRTWFRMLAFVPVLIFLPLMKFPERPDVLVSENGRAIAILEEGEAISLLYPRRNQFVTNIWSKAWSGGRVSDPEIAKEYCNSERCISTLRSGHRLHIVYDPDLLKSSCNQADILIAPRLWWVNCRARKPELILKRYDFEQRGSHAIYIDSAKHQMPAITVQTGLPDSTRPWSRDVRTIDEVRALQKINDTGE
ncbi:MAG: ComEC/Rec2 family competence protein [Pseudomonadota bacterium]